MTKEEAVAAARKVAEADGWSLGDRVRAEFRKPWFPWWQHPWWDVQPDPDGWCMGPKVLVRLDDVTGEVIDKHRPGPGPIR
jgi:hypothetical protein